MKKISVYIANKKLKPSNYYRIYQYVQNMSNVKVRVTTPIIWWELSRQLSDFKILQKFFVMLRKISSKRRLKAYLKQDLKQKPDCIVVQKSMTKYKVSQKVMKMQEELLKNTTVIWDFDDDIVLGKEISDFEYDLYCKYAKHIVVTSEYLKNQLPENCQSRVILLPTTDMQMAVSEDELKGINNKRKRRMQKQIDIVWLATGNNLFHLKSILNKLDDAGEELRLKYDKQLVLKVISNKKIKTKFNNLKIENIRWTRNRAVAEVRASSIGIMPLIDTPISRGKGGFKLIQYISTGLPVIASNVGYNSSIFKENIGFLIDDFEDKTGWKSAILELASNEKNWNECSKNSYEVWRKYYNYKDNFNFWLKLLNE